MEWQQYAAARGGVYSRESECDDHGRGRSYENDCGNDYCCDYCCDYGLVRVAFELQVHV